jgi:hypothetical protein
MNYRIKLREWALSDAANRRWLMDKCRDSFFFWLESFPMLHEPRAIASKGERSVLPFITWKLQDNFLQTLLDNYGENDVGVEKSRGLGASWCSLTLFLYKWIFFEEQILGVVSRNEETADDASDMSSLGAKIDWQLAKMPVWMVGEKDIDYVRNLGKHTWKNNRNGSLISCYATTRNLAAGGRTTAFLLDEFGRFPRPDDEHVLSATYPVTNCRFFVSTYDGVDGAYYRIMHEEGSDMVKVVLKWEDCEAMNQDMFRIDRQAGKLLKPDSDEPLENEEYSKDFWPRIHNALLTKNYDTTDTEKIWSPWFVKQCLRGGTTPRMVEQELQRNPAGASAAFFPGALIQPLLKHTMPPSRHGDIAVSQEDPHVYAFMNSPTGHLRCWHKFSQHTKAPLPGDYILACDVATGTGGAFSSNSTICILDRGTGNKVAEYASPVIGPEKFAETAIALCKWYASRQGHPGYLIWEAGGPGNAFGQRIMRSDFRNFYWRTPWDSSAKKPTKVPGWATTKGSKEALLSKYRHALQEGFFFNPSQLALRECLHYIHMPNGKVDFQGSNIVDDHSNAGANHGDRVIAGSQSGRVVESSKFVKSIHASPIII